MKKWRIIVDRPRNAFENMSIDESLLVSHIKESPVPVFRIYLWSEPSVTIGYFQKHSDFHRQGIPVVRRMTGGLSVDHGNDVSYSFIVSANDWSEINDQDKTYQLLHSVIGKALNDLNIKAEFCGASSLPRSGSVCVNTFFPHDLQIAGRKILGSCQRKRGNALLIQGSIHLKELTGNTGAFAARVSSHFEDLCGNRLELSSLSEKEAKLSENLSRTKYSSDEWNRKF